MAARTASPAPKAKAEKSDEKEPSNGSRNTKDDDKKDKKPSPMMQIFNTIKNTPRNIINFPRAFVTLFFGGPSKRMSHRLLGLIFLIQYAVSVYLHIFDYTFWLSSPFVWTVPLNGLIQSINAAITFKFLPKTEKPGFAAVADKSPLSYFTVVENSFYSMQALFASCYLHHEIKPWIQKLVVVEPGFVFFVFWFRNLWPVSSISASNDDPKHRTEANSWTLKASSYAIKGFYIYAKHFVGYFPLYLCFLDRLTPEDQHLLYHVQVLSSYAATISIFIHTLKFMGYIGDMTGMILYDVIIPGFIFLYFKMFFVIARNADVALVTLIGLIINLSPKRSKVSDYTKKDSPWYEQWFNKWKRNAPHHIYQAMVAALFYSGYLRRGTAGGVL